MLLFLNRSSQAGLVLSGLFLTLNLQAYSISGISSGAFMAAQMGVIYSSDITSVGLVAGGFFNCAGNQFQTALQSAFKLGAGNKIFFATEFDLVAPAQGHLNETIKISPQNPIYQSVQICMKHPDEASINLDALKEFEIKNLIAPLANIQNQKILLYQGQLDQVVNPKMLTKNVEFYKSQNVSDENIKIIDNPNGAHTFPTDDKKLNPCDAQGPPYVSSCDLNLAGEILKQALGTPELARNTDDDITLLHIVNQKTSDTTPESIGNYGYLGASPFCLENPSLCQIHVALHGCEMSDAFDQKLDDKFSEYIKLGFLEMYKKSERPPWRFYLPVIEDQIPQMGALAFVKEGGYMDYVNDQNRLMVLFPQTWITEKNYPGNPKGCWDWYGVSGDNYQTNQGAEPKWLNQWIKVISQDPKKYIVQ